MWATDGHVCSRLTSAGGKKRVCNTCLNIDLVRCQHSGPGLLKSGWINPGDMTLSHCTTKSTCFTKDGAAIWDKPFTRQCWINFAQKQSLWPLVILSLCLSDTILDYIIWAKTNEDLSPDSCTCHYTQYLWFNFEYVKADAGYHLGSDGINHLFSCSLSEPTARNVSSVHSGHLFLFRALGLQEQPHIWLRSCAVMTSTGLNYH